MCVSPTPCRRRRSRSLRRRSLRRDAGAQLPDDFRLQAPADLLYPGEVACVGLAHHFIRECIDLFEYVDSHSFLIYFNFETLCQLCGRHKVAPAPSAGVCGRHKGESALAASPGVPAAGKAGRALGYCR